MASEKARSRSSGRRSSGRSGKSGKSSRASRGDRRSPSSKSRTKQEFDDYAAVDPSAIPARLDVLIDIPVVKVDEIDLEVEDLHAQVAVLARVQNLVQLSVGAEARLGRVELKIEGVEVQALLKARLHNVEAILARVATTLDRNPELLESLGRSAGDVGGGARHLLDKTGEAIAHIGEGAGGAVQDLGQGAGQARPR
jgi:hypothetical protein